MSKKTLAFLDVNGTEANVALRDYLRAHYGASDKYDLLYACGGKPNDVTALLGKSRYNGILVPYDASLGRNVPFLRLMGTILADPSLFPLVIVTNPNQLVDGLELRNWLHEAADEAAGAAGTSGPSIVRYRTLNFLDVRRGFASNACPGETGLAPFEEDIDNNVLSPYDI